MHKLIDKLIISCLCLFTISTGELNTNKIIIFLISITISCFNIYYDVRISKYSSTMFILLCLLKPEFIFWIPLIFYDCLEQTQLYIKFGSILPFLIYLNTLRLSEIIMIIVFSCTTYLLHTRTGCYLDTKKQFYDILDSKNEISMYLENKNKQLMEKQDYEVKIATLNERNRIAKEIHDNVGHLLTRSILQISAAQVVHKNNDNLSAELSSIKDTLSAAMNSVRESVHDLHDESIDLNMQLCTLIKEFTFCPVKLSYDSGDLPKNLKYCFISIIHEALSNIAKHSNATEASIILLEHPAFYQLIIEDNGEIKNESDKKGIGLQNMNERVNSFNGIFRTEIKKGFKIFISIPKIPDFPK